MKDYHAIASAHYCKSPEAISVMQLTILELWVACDKSATKIHPLLSDYDHEIPTESLAALLLPFKQQMRRLADLESYLTGRNAKGPASALYSFGHSRSFPVRYFERSPRLQNIKASIEKDAEENKAQKLAELDQKQLEWDSLRRDAKRLQCERAARVINGQTVDSHSPKCAKCKLNKQAEGLKIKTYELPLPADEPLAKATVFELAVPETFGAWRDATLFLLRDVLMLEPKKREASLSKTTLSKYGGLKAFQEYAVTSRRVGIVSDSGPHSGGTRKDSIVNIQDSDVIVPNNLNWRYVDCEKDEFLGRMVQTNHLSDQCTFELDADSKALQCFLSRPLDAPNGPEPNSVIAKQYTCPKHMSLSEFKALASMNYGDNLIWINHLAEFAMPRVR